MENAPKAAGERDCELKCGETRKHSLRPNHHPFNSCHFLLISNIVFYTPNETDTDRGSSVALMLPS